MGIGFAGSLVLVFIVLKLIGVIHLGWLWLVLPLLLGVALVVLFFIISIIVLAHKS